MHPTETDTKLVLQELQEWV